MAKKVLLRDLKNIEILPITRGELILDSSGKEAFHSNEFLATDSLPGLMSKEDKIKINNMIATKVANKLTIKVNSGTTEGTSLYTYDGSKAKTLDIKLGSGIGLTTASGVITLTNSGVRAVSTGDSNGTIKVNTNGTNTNVAVKGLGSAAYTNSTAYAIKQELKSEDLNTIITPGFYNAGGGNTVTNKPDNVEHFGLLVIHGASGSYYVQILYEESYSNLVWRRHCINGTWSTWTKDALTDTHWTSHLYIGAKDAASNASTTNNSTYLKLFDNSTLRHQYNIKGTGNTTVTSDSNGNISINSPITLSWNSITDKPTAFTPTSHNHPSNQINALTGYSKSTTAVALAASDTLNAALGKLEYKADLGKTVYDWYKSITGTDTDTIVNKWEEIVSFIDSVAEGTDIIDEFVTRKTDQQIIGAKTFTKYLNVNITGSGGDNYNENYTKPYTNKALVIGPINDGTIALYINRSGILTWNTLNDTPKTSNGTVTIPTLSILGAGGNTQFGGNIGPIKDLTYSLGASNYRWKYFNGMRIGQSNNSVFVTAKFPRYSEEAIREFYKDGYTYASGTVPSVEQYFKALCRWAINTYEDNTSYTDSVITLIGQAAPGYTGTLILSLYIKDSKDETGLPKYCSGEFISLDLAKIYFSCNGFKSGTTNSLWTWSNFNETNRGKSVHNAYNTNDKNCPILFSLDSSNKYAISYFDSAVTINPYNNSITATSFIGTATASQWLDRNDKLEYGASGLQYFQKNSTESGTAPNENVTPGSGWWHIIRMNHGNAGGYFTDLASSFNGSLYYRHVYNGINYGWYRIIDSNNYKDTLYKQQLVSIGPLTSGTWYRCAALATSNGSRSLNTIISLQRSYNSPLNEHYIFSISIGYDGQVNISQLSGCTGGHLITKVRVVYSNNGYCYFDFYVNTCTYSNQYTILILAGDCVSTQVPAITTATGGIEFTTVNGMSSNYGFTGLTQRQFSSTLATANNLAAYYGSSSTTTGIIKITLPYGWTRTMAMYEVKIYEYNSKVGSTLTISGYNYSDSTTSDWINYGYTVDGDYDKLVRLAYDGSKCCILLGTTTTTWAYPQVFLNNICGGYNGVSSLLSNNYSISLITSESGLTKIRTCGAKSSVYKLKANKDFSHSHSLYYFSGLPTIGTAAGQAKVGSNTYQYVSYPENNTSNDGTKINAFFLRMLWSTNYLHEIFATTSKRLLWHRHINNNNPKAWSRIVMEDNGEEDTVYKVSISGNADSATLLKSSGRMSTMLTGTNKPSKSGLTLNECYNLTGAPVSYGNILLMQGDVAKGCGELLCEWTSSTAPGKIYYRSQRNITDGWSYWKQLIDSDGGTINKILYFNHDDTNYAQIVYKNTRMKSDGGGWADSILTLKNNDSENVAFLGMFGSQNTLTYLYMGTGAYNAENNLRIYADKISTPTLTPNADAMYNLGTSTLKWSTVYANSFVGNLTGNATSANNIYLNNSNGGGNFPLIFTNTAVAGAPLRNQLYTASTNTLHYNPLNTLLTVPKISLATTAGFWKTGKNHTSPSINISTKQTGSYHPILNVETINSHYISLGGISDLFGFLGYHSSLTGNGTTWRTYWNVSDGVLIHTNSIQAAGGFFQTSDATLKIFKEDIKVDFDKLKSIPKKYFYWKSDDTCKLLIGTSAQEVQKYYPELVSSNDGILSVAYDKLSILALKSIDELYEMIISLKSENEELRNKINSLNN